MDVTNDLLDARGPALTQVCLHMHVFPGASGTALGGWRHGHGFCGKDTTSQSSNCTCEHSACVQAMELVFVSLDENQRAFQSHYATMPWKALPFVDKGRKVSLRNRFVVNGHNIPKLVILDQKGLIIHDDGMSSVDLTSFAPPQPPTLLSYDFLWAGVGMFTWSWSESSPPFVVLNCKSKLLRKRILHLFLTCVWAHSAMDIVGATPDVGGVGSLMAFLHFR